MKTIITSSVVSVALALCLPFALAKEKKHEESKEKGEKGEKGEKY